MTKMPSHNREYLRSTRGRLCAPLQLRVVCNAKNMTLTCKHHRFFMRGLPKLGASDEMHGFMRSVNRDDFPLAFLEFRFGVVQCLILMHHQASACSANSPFGVIRADAG